MSNIIRFPGEGDRKNRLTYRQKSKNKFEEMRHKMDAIDLYYGNYRDYDRIDRLKINYDLYNGKLDVNLYDDPTCFTIQGEEVFLDYQNISHYPLTSQIANAIVGEQEGRPFKPTVRDNTPHRQTYLKQDLNQRITSFLRNDLEKRRRAILQGLVKSSGITDLYSLNPNQQIELSNQVDTILQQQTPEEILEYFQYDWQSPSARQAQKMVDFLVDYHDIKWTDVEVFKHGVISGEGYVYEGERNEKLVFEDVHPMFFDWGGSMNTEWSQHGTWAKRENWLTVEDAQQRHALYLNERDLKDLEFQSEPLGGIRDFYDWDNNEAMKKVMYTYSVDKGIQEKYSGTDIKTREGQRKMLDMYSDIFGYKDSKIIGDSRWGIREAHIVWRDKRLLKRVTRIVGDKKQKFWVDEHYTPTAKDWKVQKVWVDEVWEGYKLGSFQSKYVGIRPVPYQYKSLDCPFGVNLPYYGRRYNTHGNVTKNVSIIDIGKTLQKDFDVTMASLKHDMATNIGSAYVMFMNMKPEGMKWQEWMDMIRNSNIILADAGKRGLNQFDYTMSKEVRLSKMADIAGKIQLLEFFRANHARSMFFNDARLGAIGQYATGVNTETNQVASYNQTARHFEIHRKIMEKALQGFLCRARHYYKDNLNQAAVFLDDISLAELQVGPYSSYKDMGVHLTNSTSELQRLTNLRANTQAFIQNGVSPLAIMDMQFAETEGEIRDIIKKETVKAEKLRQETLAAQQQQSQLESQTELEKENIKAQTKMQLEREKLASQERRAALDATKFERANDIDRDGQADLLESALAKIEADLIKHKGNLQFKYDELRMKAESELKRKIRSERGLIKN